MYEQPEWLGKGLLENLTSGTSVSTEESSDCPGDRWVQRIKIKKGSYPYRCRYTGCLSVSSSTILSEELWESPDSSVVSCGVGRVVPFPPPYSDYHGVVETFLYERGDGVERRRKDYVLYEPVDSHRFYVKPWKNSERTLGW